MRQLFEISVKISDQKFKIYLIEDKRVVEFNDIFPKLKEVAKIGANEDIDFKTHYFELFEQNEHAQSTIGSPITSYKDNIRHKSLITIKSKSKEGILGSDGHLINESTSEEITLDSGSHSSSLSHESSVDPNKNNSKGISKSKPLSIKSEIKSKPLPDIPHLERNRRAVEDFHRIVLAINIGWNFRTDNPITVWRKVSAALRSESIVISAENCCSIFETWINYYGRNYDIFEGKINGCSQQIFDLLKVVHTLDLRHFLRDTNKTLHKIESIAKTGLSKEYFRKHLTEIHEKKLKENRKRKEKELEDSIFSKIMSSPKKRNRRGIDLTTN